MMSRRILLLLALLLAGSLGFALLWRPVGSDPALATNDGDTHADRETGGHLQGPVDLPTAGPLATERPADESVALHGRTGGMLRVLIVDPEGRAVPRVQLDVGQPSYPALRERARRAPQTLRFAKEMYRTDILEVREGLHVLARASLHEPYMLFACRPRDAHGTPLNLQGAGSMGVLQPDTREIRIVMPRGRTVRGHVVDQAGTPLPGFTVEALRSPYRYRPLIEARSDANGNVVLTGLPHETVSVSCEQEGYQSVHESIDPEVETVELALTRIAILTLRVLGPDGEPIPKLLLRVGWTQGASTNGHKVRTDGAGQIALEEVPLGAEVRLETVWEAGMPDVGLVEMEAVFENDDPIVVRLPRPLAIRGTVVDEDGEPIVWGTVTAVREDVAGAPPPIRAPIQNGRFHLRRLRSGPYRLQATGPPDRAPLVERVVRAPQANLRLVLKRGHTLRGRVMSERPERTRVTWYGPHGSIRRVAVNPEGRFEFHGLNDEPGALLAEEHVMPAILAAAPRADEWVAGRRALLENVRPSDSPYDVHLLPGAALEIHLVCGSESAETMRGSIPPLVVECVRGNVRIPAGETGRWHWRAGRAIGSMTARALPPGTWRLEVRSEGASQPLAVERARAPGRITIRLPH